MKRTSLTLSAIALAIAATLAIAQPGGWGGGPGAGCGNGPGAGAGQAAADGTCPMGQGRGMGMGPGAGDRHGSGRPRPGRPRRDAADAGRASRLSRPDARDDDRRGLQGGGGRTPRADRAARQGAGRDGAGRSARRSLRADEGPRHHFLISDLRDAAAFAPVAGADAAAFYSSSPACAISAALPPAAVGVDRHRALGAQAREGVAAGRVRRHHRHDHRAVGRGQRRANADDILRGKVDQRDIDHRSAPDADIEVEAGRAAVGLAPRRCVLPGRSHAATAGCRPRSRRPPAASARHRSRQGRPRCPAGAVPARSTRRWVRERDAARGARRRAPRPVPC